MPIQPIDQQILFARLGEIGREVAMQKDGIVQGQSVVAGEIAKRSEDIDKTVTEPADLQDGPEQVQEDEEREESRGRGEKRREEKQEQEPPVFRDPKLGANVDLLG